MKSNIRTTIGVETKSPSRRYETKQKLKIELHDLVHFERKWLSPITNFADFNIPEIIYDGKPIRI